MAETNTFKNNYPTTKKKTHKIIIIIIVKALLEVLSAEICPLGSFKITVNRGYSIQQYTSTW